jgi:hypothetical protein
MKITTLIAAIIIPATAIQANAQSKSDSELRAAIETHPWYSARHNYEFLPNGTIAVNGFPTEEKWSIQNGLLYREWKKFSIKQTTKIIEINDGQLVEQEISGRYKGAVEIMYSRQWHMGYD